MDETKRKKQLMKVFIGHFFVMLLFFNYGANVWLFVSFYENQGFLSELHCVNKAKPLLNCKGRCYLSQSLNKDQNGLISTSHFNCKIEMIYEQHDIYILPKWKLLSILNNIYLYRFFLGFKSNVFQPPEHHTGFFPPKLVYFQKH